MSEFKGIEDRIRRECDMIGQNKADELFKKVAVDLGYNPNGGTWWASDELLTALKPMRTFAKQRFADLEFQRVWADAEKAALDALKKPRKEPTP